MTMIKTSLLTIRGHAFFSGLCHSFSCLLFQPSHLLCIRSIIGGVSQFLHSTLLLVAFAHPSPHTRSWTSIVVHSLLSSPSLSCSQGTHASAFGRRGSWKTRTDFDGWSKHSIGTWGNKQMRLAYSIHLHHYYFLPCLTMCMCVFVGCPGRADAAWQCCLCVGLCLCQKSVVVTWSIHPFLVVIHTYTHRCLCTNNAFIHSSFCLRISTNSVPAPASSKRQAPNVQPHQSRCVLPPCGVMPFRLLAPFCPTEYTLPSHQRSLPVCPSAHTHAAIQKSRVETTTMNHPSLLPGPHLPTYAQMHSMCDHHQSANCLVLLLGLDALRCISCDGDSAHQLFF
ncbi:hypothetical protein HDK90DRAFT_344493 [Phyllosticta capitalensis]|uniref:Uncharacterized protein n=1 Tax=Phyllosticta capitalensis TaxID=121624 RepID=A0ABR1YG70_9PEZI